MAWNYSPQCQKGGATQGFQALILKQPPLIRGPVAGLYFIILKNTLNCTWSRDSPINLAPIYKCPAGFSEFAGPDEGSKQAGMAEGLFTEYIELQPPT